MKREGGKAVESCDNRSSSVNFFSVPENGDALLRVVVDEHGIVVYVDRGSSIFKKKWLLRRLRLRILI